MTTNAIRFAYPAKSGLVSVILPTYNRARIVQRAIDSALAQTCPSIEIVVVDDGSTDDTPSVLARYDARVRVIRQRNAGVAAARNTGLSHAKGEFIAFLDSDDYWLPWKVEAEMAVLRAHPDVGLVWTDMSAEDANGRIVKQRYLRTMYRAYNHISIESIMPQYGVLRDLVAKAPAAYANAPLRIGDLSTYILLGNLLHTSTVLFRRVWAERAGGFDPSWGNGGEDYEYYTRLCALGAVALIDAPSIAYRVGAEDQLTAPDKLLTIARNNLRTVRARFADANRRAKLPRSDVRNRLAWSLQWVGSTEFEAGNRWAAAKHLAASLRVKFGLDRRWLYLAACALPTPAVDGLRVLKRQMQRVRATAAR